VARVINLSRFMGGAVVLAMMLTAANPTVSTTPGTWPGTTPGGPQPAGAADKPWIEIAIAASHEIVAQDWPRLIARFDDRMKAALSADRLAAVWVQVVSGGGGFVGVRQAVVTEGLIHTVVLTCRLQRGELDIRVSLDAEGRIAGLFLQPTQPDSGADATANERSLVVGEAQLPARLVLPSGPGPWPAVVLVHGSGPHDQDETIAAAKPFRDLALGLAAHGVGSLRYVKRTRHAPGGFAPDKKFTVREETIDDARAAVALLAVTPGVDPRRIWVVGHSLGGYLAPRIADGDAQVAGIVILAGHTRPTEDVIIDQMTRLAPERRAQAEAEARAIRDPQLTDGTLLSFLGSRTPGSYFLDLRGYDPPKVAARLTIPILVLQGERDFQVGLVDYRGWTAALARRNNATLKLYPRLNHLFQSGTAPSLPEEYAEPGHHVDDQVIRDIAAFVTRKR
jgi:uncharacterized protein